MPIDGILFRQSGPPLKMRIAEAGAVRDAAGKRNLPAVVVVRKESLGLFAEHPQLFIDQHRKDSRKGLSRMLLGHGVRFPFIDAEFSSLGRLKQSAEALIGNARKKHENGIYILGVSEERFSEAWEFASARGTLADSDDGQSGLPNLLKPLPGERVVAASYWGESAAFHRVRQYILYAARTDTPVLIVGETGTGKGIVARQIHEQQRQGKPFVTVNCAAIPSDLFESELFGYVKGAFTHALDSGKMGQWERANGGTLYLDEIGDLPPDQQAKVLRALHDKEILRLGAVVPTPVTARVVAATNRNLIGMVRTGRFREDLLYRLIDFIIRTPSLREHPEDIPVIAQELWESKIAGPGARLPDDILSELCTHRWPGNVRELRSVLSRLNNFFGTKNLACEQLKWVFQDAGLVAGYGSQSFEEDASGTLQLDCLRTIRNADDVLHVCEQVLQAPGEGRRLSDAARESLARTRRDMQSLLHNRLYFGSRRTYEAVARVEEQLGRMLNIPSRKHTEITESARARLRPAIRQAVDCLFAELDRLLHLAAANVPAEK